MHTKTADPMHNVTTRMGNVNMSDDPVKQHELDAITNEDEETGMPESDVENVLGSVHISKPSIKHVFFLLRPFLKPILEAFNKQEHELHELVNMMKLERVFIDKPTNLSANISYEVNYLGRKFLYLYTSQTLTLGISAGGTVTAGANVWTPLIFPQGTKVTANGVNDSNPVGVTIRACDVPMALFAELISGGASIGNVGSTSDYPVGAIPLTASSGNVANATATATLAAVAGKTTYITGFEITGAGSTAGLVVTPTVAGVITGTLSYTYAGAIGVLVANESLIVQFPKAIPASGQNVTIVVSCPGIGGGNTNNTVVAHGYQL